MTKSINREIQLISTNDRLHVSGCLVNIIRGKVTIGQHKFKTEVGSDQKEFTGMIYFLDKVYICVYFFLYEYDILYIYCVIVSIIYGEFINLNLLYIVYMESNNLINLCSLNVNEMHSKEKRNRVIESNVYICAYTEVIFNLFNLLVT